MKTRWLSTAFLAVALAVSACGPTEEAAEPAQVADPGVNQMLLNCDEEGNCPAGYECDPGWVCRRIR